MCIIQLQNVGHILLIFLHKNSSMIPLWSVYSVCTRYDFNSFMYVEIWFLTQHRVYYSKSPVWTSPEYIFYSYQLLSWMCMWIQSVMLIVLFKSFFFFFGNCITVKTVLRDYYDYRLISFFISFHSVELCFISFEILLLDTCKLRTVILFC